MIDSAHPQENSGDEPPSENRPTKQKASALDPAMKKHLKEELDRFHRLCPPDQEPVLTVLRGHLLTEYNIERLLVLELPRGNRLAGDTLSYAQKLAVLESIGILTEQTIECLRGLNRVRNSCAHEMDRDITWADVERIGRPLGPEFTALRRKHSPDVQALLGATISAICRDMSYKVYVVESRVAERHEAASNSTRKQPRPAV